MVRPEISRRRHEDGALAEVFNHYNAATVTTSGQQAERERDEAWQKQSKISQQLSVLKEGGPLQGELRVRYVR